MFFEIDHMRAVISTIIYFIISFILSFSARTQGIHASQLSYYNSLGNSEAQFYESLPYDTLGPVVKQGCDLNKMVYGWHPYWVGSAYQNYQWDLLSHLSFFSYEVDYTTGNAVSTHGWATSAAVNAALTSGNTKVTLCVTLFANHTSFLTNATAKQNLIDNLISLITTRGAHGVNIDFEGLPSSQASNFANFMVSLANQMHAAIPGSEVSTVLYSVDWNSVFNFSIMEPAVDYYIIMGYDYYYSGSSTAGPNDPLFHFGSTYNYSLSRSITDYLKVGCPLDKLILGLPYYGREWSTTSLTVPSGTTATGVSRTYSYIQNNSSGYYSTANHSYENDSQSDMYLFMNGSTPKQCFITEEDAFDKRLKHVLQTGIGGIGIWALGYDDGYMNLWNSIEDNLTECYSDPCAGTIHDFGGPNKNYYNSENYTWTIAPPNATSMDINFSLFDVELNYDYLYIYDGNSIASTQIPGSPFSGTNSPGTFTTSGGAVTFRFTSDISTVKPGFLATYTCNQDNILPSTIISALNNWQTVDFTVNYTDTDNSLIDNRFSLITDNDGALKSGNRSLGYLYEDFSTVITNQWTIGLGNWSITSGKLLQSSDTEGNSACNATLNQSSSIVYVYNWKGKIGGSGSNRRAGLHFFCSDPTLPNRGDSYLVYWRVDSDKCQIYRSTGDNLVLQTDDVVLVDPDIEYDFKIIYNPANGEVKAYLNNQLCSSWIDPSPISNGNSVSWRSGNCTFNVDDVKVFQSRGTSQTISIGSPTSQVRYQNVNPTSPNCTIYSLVIDDAGNFSPIVNEQFNIDWTEPASVNVNDGFASDINSFVTPTEISANWTSSSDQHSDLVEYFVAVGTSIGATDIVSFTSNGLQLSKTFAGLSLTFGQTYYISVKSVNGAGLESLVSCSNGQTLETPTSPPIANFQINESVICEGDSILLLNTSSYGDTYTWSSNDGIFSDSTEPNPYFTPFVSGNSEITLEASNSAGTNQFTQIVNITVISGPVASAIPDQTNLALPNAIVLFNNTSQNADNYFWDFGDGEVSGDQNPWHQYTGIGTYEVQLIAIREGCQNDTSYFIINVGQAGIMENSKQAIQVFPNPFSNNLIVNGSRIEELLLYDLQGKLIFHKSFSGQSQLEVQINTSIEKGMYILKINDNGVFYSERLVKF